LFPLFHKEDSDAQQRLYYECEGFAQKCDEAGDQIWKERYEGLMKYAMMQKELIEEYGRFPYRNEALGRRNTPEEDEYMRKRNMK